MRPSRRQPDELRPVSLERGVVKFAEGSCFVKFGETHVLVTATLEDRLPPWLKGQGRGWITAEYGMLPRATLERTRREASAGKQSGRTVEIQRLIGRSLRSVVDLKALGERQITIDCDVIQADGGTRTASITGAWIALYDCLAWMKTRDMVQMEVLARSYRGDFLRRARRRGGARSRLRRGFASRHRRQFRPHRHRQYRGNTGHRREDAVFRGSSLPRCWRWRAKASPSWSTCRRWQSDERRGTSIAASPAVWLSPPTIPASSPRCANCLRLTASTPYRRVNSICRNRTKTA